MTPRQPMEKGRTLCENHHPLFEYSYWSPELEFLNKIPNHGILESWIRGEAEFEDIFIFAQKF
jgi:hypothetical protein